VHLTLTAEGKLTLYDGPALFTPDTRPLVCPHGAEWNGTIWTKVRTSAALVAAAREYADHVRAAACWPTPGIGCDGNCREAAALRAALDGEK
jgi:hypothetical protein